MVAFRDMVRAELMEMQQGRCAICPSAGPFVIDHDHETGLVRGLLCRACNSREGQCRSRNWRSEPDEAMLAYLADPPAARLGWQWDIPDPRQNPARIEADYWAAWDLVNKRSYPIPGVTPPPPVQERAPEPEATSIEVAAGPAAPVVEVAFGPLPKPKRRRRPKATPVTFEEAMAALALVPLTPLPPLPPYRRPRRSRVSR